MSRRSRTRSKRYFKAVHGRHRGRVVRRSVRGVLGRKRFYKYF